MILVLNPAMGEQQQHEFCLTLQKRGFFTRLINQNGQLLVSLDGSEEEQFCRDAASINGVIEVIPGKHSYFLASRRCQRRNSLVKAGVVGGRDVVFGGDNAVVIAGPCAIETEESALALAEKVAALGCCVFRSMIFKPRSSPYSFQGLGRAGIPILQKIRQQTGLLLLSEVRDNFEAELMAEHADILQVGTRNMSNYQLLKHLGQFRKPVMLKRGMGASVEELLCAAEYIMSHGNTEVILCERGIRTFEQYTRFSLDIGAVPVIKELSHLPVIIDPSHASGKSHLVSPLAMAGLAAGADGLMIEVHQQPDSAFSDGAQSLNPQELSDLINKGRKVAQAIGRELV